MDEMENKEVKKKVTWNENLTEVWSISPRDAKQKNTFLQTIKKGFLGTNGAGAISGRLLIGSI